MKPSPDENLLRRALDQIEKQNGVIADMAKMAMDHALRVKDPNYSAQEIQFQREKLAADREAMRTYPAMNKHYRPGPSEPDMDHERSQDLAPMSETDAPID